MIPVFKQSVVAQWIGKGPQIVSLP